MPIDRVRDSGTVFRKKLNAKRPAVQQVGPIDPFWPQVLLLLHFDNGVGSTVFIDSSSYNRTMLNIGTPSQVASPALFNQSLDCPNQFSPSLVYTNDVTGFNFGLKDYTFEISTYQEIIPDFPDIFTLTNGSDILFEFFFSDLAPNMCSVSYYEKNIPPVQGQLDIAPIQLNIWQRWAFERWFNSSLNMYIYSGYLNGNRVSQLALSTGYDFNTTSFVKIGAQFTNSLNGTQGYYDEVRFTSGARFQGAASYPLSIGPFPNG